MFFFAKKKKNKKALVFDISSGTVGGAVVSYEDKLIPDVQASYRDVIPFDKSIQGKNAEAYCIKSIDKVCSVLIKKSYKVDSVHVMLSSPWASWKTEKIKINEKVPFMVSESMIRSLIEKDLEEKKNHEYKLEVEIERKITDVKINGYSVEKPFGKKVKNLEIPYFASVSSKKTIDEISKIINKNFNFKQIHFHSMPFLIWSGLRDLIHQENDFMVVIMHGEQTDIVAGKHNHIFGTCSFPIGTRTILRKYSEKFKSSHNLALSEISMLSASMFQDSSPETKKNDFFEKLSLEWLKEITDFLIILENQNVPPKKIYIASDFLIEKHISEMLTKHIHETSHKDLGIEIVPLSNTVFNALISSGFNIKGDVFLDLTATSLERFVLSEKN